jgi:hypothetical protein
MCGIGDRRGDSKHFICEIILEMEESTGHQVKG